MRECDFMLAQSDTGAGQPDGELGRVRTTDDNDAHYCIGVRLKLEGKTENMGVWTKKRGGMKAVVLMATPCPKSLHGKGEKCIARNI